MGSSRAGGSSAAPPACPARPAAARGRGRRGGPARTCTAGRYRGQYRGWDSGAGQGKPCVEGRGTCLAENKRCGAAGSRARGLWQNGGMAACGGGLRWRPAAAAPPVCGQRPAPSLVGVLCNQVELHHAALHQVLGLVQDGLPGLGPELAPAAADGVARRAAVRRRRGAGRYARVAAGQRSAPVLGLQQEG